MWLRLVVGGMVLKIRNLENRIKSEKDEKKKLDLISSQNSMLSYISGLGIGVGSSDKVLLSKLRKGMSGGGGRGK